MVITRQQNETVESNPSVTKFSKEQNELKMKEVREFAANTATDQYHLNLHVLGLNDCSTFAEMIKAIVPWLVDFTLTIIMGLTLQK